MPNIMDEPDPHFLPPQRSGGLQRVARVVGQSTLAALVMVAWVSLAVAAGTAAFVVIRLCLWGARSILTALGI